MTPGGIYLRGRRSSVVLNMILLKFLLDIQVELVSGRLIYKRDLEWKCKLERHWNIYTI